MTTTVRLLATYDGSPPQTLRDLPDALAASFVAVGNASLNLTGGVRRYQNVAAPVIVSAKVLGSALTVVADKKSTFTLPKGQAVAAVGGMGAVGVLRRVGPAGETLQSQIVSEGTQAQFGPYTDDQTLELSCASGSISLDNRGAAAQAILASAPRGKRLDSILWLGDSLTMQGGLDRNPVIPPSVKTFETTYSVPQVAPNGNIRNLQVSETCALGAGTLRFYAADKTLTWQAFGDTEGRRVNISTGGYFAVPSGTPGSELYIAWLASIAFAPADASNTITISATPSLKIRASLGGFSGFWQALRGFPFRRSINFGISGATTNDFISYMPQWSGIVTDITVIAGGTNDAETKAGKDQALENIKTIVADRKAAGSIPIVVLPFLGSYLSATSYQNAVYFNDILKTYCITNNVLFVDATPYLTNPFVTNGGARTGAFRSDNLHLSGSGAYLVAKYAFDPVIAPLVPVLEPAVSTGTYNATTCPTGNLLATPGIPGSVSAVSAPTGVTGTKPTAANIYRGANTASCVSTAPQSGSPVLRTDGKPGAWWRNVITNPAGPSDSYFFDPCGAINTANYAVGDKLVFSGEIRFSGAKIDFIQVYLNSNKGSVYAITIDTYSTSVGDLYGEVFSSKFETEPLVVKAGMTDITALFYVGVGSGGNCTFDISPTLNVRKVP